MCWLPKRGKIDPVQAWAIEVNAYVDVSETSG